MIGIYFSGTGNSRWALEFFLQEYEGRSRMYSIEDEDALKEIEKQKEIVFSYPVQYSNLPKMVRDFIVCHKNLWKGHHGHVFRRWHRRYGQAVGEIRREDYRRSAFADA